MYSPSHPSVLRAPSGTPGHVGSLNAAKRQWRWLRNSLFGPYRPELHYMRGPGPKCRERDNGNARP